MSDLLKHPAPLKAISIEHDEDLDEVHLVFECSSPDSAELIYRAIAASMRAGTMSFGGMTFTKATFKPEEQP